jgi:hypothetical protein
MGGPPTAPQAFTPGTADTGAATMAKLDNSVTVNTIPKILAILVFTTFKFSPLLFVYHHKSTYDLRSLAYFYGDKVYLLSVF